MNKKGLMILVAAAFAVLAVSGMVMAETPETIIIDKVMNKKSAVTLPHKAHADQFDCVTCHHTATGTEDVQSCFACHGTDPAAPDPTVSSKKENPFHIQCIGCHQEKAAGPTKCKECHT